MTNRKEHIERLDEELTKLGNKLVDIVYGMQAHKIPFNLNSTKTKHRTNYR